MSSLQLRFLFSFGLLVLTSPAAAVPLFPSSPAIEKRARFWEKIFTEYSSDVRVVHDLENQDLILGTCAIDGDCTQYDSILLAFAKRGAKARHMSPTHKKVWTLYAKEKKTRTRLLNGDVRIRTQGGLSDVFIEAAARADLYLPHMEKIFRAHALPVELTRIPFVESMFNGKARSKVGASGIWQLMPSAARPHIKVNRRIDERNSPLKATLAAARILKQNKEILGNWPLAITAYNHGVNGIRRGVERTGSRELSRLIQNYRSPSWGFASNNFYAEFLAAKRVYKRLQEQKRMRLSSQP